MDGVLPALLRGIHLVAVLSAFGSLVFAALLRPADPGLRHAASLSCWVGRISAVAAVLSGLAWLLLATASIAEVQAPLAVGAELPVVALHTQFGRFLTLRLALLILMLLLPDRPSLQPVKLLLTAGALAVQPMLSHAGAESGPIGGLLVAAEIIHLAAAGAWLGGLPPLWLAIRRLPLASGLAACARFSAMGVPAVLLILAGGVVLAASLVGSPGALAGTAYGRLVLLKTGLFALALGLATLNRYRLAGILAREARRAPLLLSIALEAALGLAIVLAAAQLASQVPGADHGMRNMGSRTAARLLQDS